MNNGGLPLWRKSTRSAGTGDCVEVADVAEGVAVRDSKDPSGPKLTLTLNAWRGLLRDVKAEEPSDGTI
ncbi:DUF397 domain-containing protein [Actinomadura sp. KC216]|uniref:DUF397 domain-containing protein n=1 Tax=Actinomadura sp. KC216 TaxID=2530370 RepID=UPI00104F97D9|nr:DUF397 domain-containing protein [Actinomadura sp. KC216]TDB84317.1 DUF397 domain-containing protein [Actinomadura sp. KC216]